MAVPLDFRDLARVSITACGTAFYAGLVGRYWFERIAGLNVAIDVASELRYRRPVPGPSDLFLAISQSGETADTLAALRHAVEAGQRTLAIVNVPGSTMTREAWAVAPSMAGPEIGVASTKAFTCQMMVLLCLAVAAGRARGMLDGAGERRLVDAMAGIPALMAEATRRCEPVVEALARDIAQARNVVFVGRGPSYPLALEGALKLKETSYINAQGYAAGEMKHGPIAQIDGSVPVIAIAPPDEFFGKTMSNVHEIEARGGRIVLISGAAETAAPGTERFATVAMPDIDPILAPLIYAVPLQLLAYHVAAALGKDVDQPRNLAKCVTVE